jgi:hypothetical protein
MAKLASILLKAVEHKRLPKEGWHNNEKLVFGDA